MVDIDGDGSFLMNCQELATIFIEKLDVKCFIMNNQHLGMVVQWEDRFYKKNRAHTYLGHRVCFWVLPVGILLLEVPAVSNQEQAKQTGCLAVWLQTGYLAERLPGIAVTGL